MEYLKLFSDLNIDPIPLDFSNTLTTTRWLLDIENKINEIVEEYNNIREEIKVDVSKEFEQRVNELKIIVNDLRGEVENRLGNAFKEINNIEDSIEMLDRKVDKNAQIANEDDLLISNEFDLKLKIEIEKLNKKINRFNDFLNVYSVTIENYYAKKMIELENSLDKKISIKNADNLIVYNLWKGKSTSLNQCLKDIYESTRFQKLTWREINKAKMTWNDLNNKNLMWAELENNGRFLLFNELYLGKVYREHEELKNKCNEMLEKCRTEYLKGFSPFDGKRKNVFDIINELCNLHKNGITAAEFDALQISAQEFDDLMLTAYEVDWEGKEKIVKP